jgi:hypothetical protein
MALRAHRRRRWTITIAAAALSLAIAVLLRDDSSALLLSTAAFSVGALLAVGEMTLLAHRYGGLDPASLHAGEEVEIAVSRPGLAACLAPIAMGSFAAVGFLLAAHASPVTNKTTVAVITFAAICSGAVGFDAVGAALTGRWERATGLGIYRPQCRLHWKCVRATYVAVVERPAAGATRFFLPALLAAASTVLLFVSLADLRTLRLREAPWTADLPTVRAETPASHVDPALGSVASKLAGRTVEVRCWSHSDWSAIHRARGDSAVGFADLHASRISLAPMVCRPLMALEYRGEQPAYGSDAAWWLSFAVVALGHEAGHIALGRNESRAECFGLRSARSTAIMLGADATYAVLLQGTYCNLIYPQRDAVYRAGGCQL